MLIWVEQSRLFIFAQQTMAYVKRTHKVGFVAKISICGNSKAFSAISKKKPSFSFFRAFMAGGSGLRGAPASAVAQTSGAVAAGLALGAVAREMGLGAYVGSGVMEYTAPLTTAIAKFRHFTPAIRIT